MYKNTRVNFYLELEVVRQTRKWIISNYTWLMIKCAMYLTLGMFNTLAFIRGDVHFSILLFFSQVGFLSTAQYSYWSMLYTKTSNRIDVFDYIGVFLLKSIFHLFIASQVTTCIYYIAVKMTQSNKNIIITCIIASILCISFFLFNFLGSQISDPDLNKNRFRLRNKYRLFMEVTKI